MPFAASRFSPMRFDEAHVATEEDVDLLLEAARRAPSAGNSQPWAFIVARRGDPTHQRLVPHLARSASVWAPTASILVANLSQRLVEGSEFAYSEFAHYDLGQAVAHMTFQADAIGLSVHQLRAFHREAMTAEFGVPRHWEITTMAAFGVPLGCMETHGGAGTSRDRRSTRDVTWARG